MFVLQCNFKEYVENDHDGNYSWYRLCVDNDGEKDFAVGFNIQRFKNHEAEITSIISKIKEIWKQSCGAQVALLNTITNVAALKKDDYEMIVSVHFWFDKSVIDDGIEDTQYMKIVYTASSIDGIIVEQVERFIQYEFNGGSMLKDYEINKPILETDKILFVGTER